MRCDCDASLAVIYDPTVDMFGWYSTIFCIVDGGRVKGLTRIHLICILWRRRENYPAIDVFVIEPRAQCTNVYTRGIVGYNMMHV